jgi:hypothetical protein
MMRPMFHGVIGAIRTSAAARWHYVREVRSQTRSTLGHQRRVRYAATRAFRHALHKHRAAIIASVRTAAGAPAHTAAETRPPAATPHTSAWDLSFEPLSGRFLPTPTETLDAQVLRVIEGHPEGVRAREVGNELGVDWRRVVGITQSLVDAGKVDQVEQELYPVGKASPRW